MDTSNTNDIQALMARPVWQLTCAEFCELTRYANSRNTEQKSATPQKLASGVENLAEELSCSRSMVYELKKAGVLEGSIVSSIGRKTVYDVEKARAAAESFMQRERAIRRGEVATVEE